MRHLIAFILLLGAGLPAGAAPISVQNALKAVPKEQAKGLVRIEARDGTPLPERWYIQVYDASQEKGLLEFVVSEKGVVASRPLSQFLGSATADDVVAIRVVKIDTDDLIKLAQQYAEANRFNVAKINYTLARDPNPPPNPNGATPVPLWTLSCYDDAGKKLGELVINSRNANIISHAGFDLVPGQPSAKPAVAATPAAPVAPGATPAPASAPAGEPVVKPATAVVKPATAATPPPAAAAAPTPKPRGGLFRMFQGKPKATPTPPPR